MPPTAGAVPWPRALPDAENMASPSLAPVAAASASPGWSLTRSPGSGRCRLPALDFGVRASCRETDTAGKVQVNVYCRALCQGTKRGLCPLPGRGGSHGTGQRHVPARRHTCCVKSSGLALDCGVGTESSHQGRPETATTAEGGPCARGEGRERAAEATLEGVSVLL